MKMSENISINNVINSLVPTQDLIKVRQIKYLKKLRKLDLK